METVMNKGFLPPPRRSKCSTVLEHLAFTLAEVLIVIGIIGMVADMTIPTLIQNFQDKQFKVAYKKAYSDLNQVLLMARSNNELPYDTATEWAIMKKNLKIIKSCESNNAYSCWVNADRVCTGACDPEGSGIPSGNWHRAFIDAGGRSWVSYGGFQIYLVDTNGMKKPNKFGKDRWPFQFKYQNGEPIKILPYNSSDNLVKSSWCTYPPCYYQSWLFN